MQALCWHRYRTGPLHEGKTSLTQALCWHGYRTGPLHKGKASLTQVYAGTDIGHGLYREVRLL